MGQEASGKGRDPERLARAAVEQALRALGFTRREAAEIAAALEALERGQEPEKPP